MGDRCYVHCGVRPEDAEKLEKILEGVLQPDWNDCGEFKTLIIEEAADGAGEELQEAAEAGLVFYGYSTPGDNYPATSFASNGDGILYFVQCLWDHGYTPVVRLTDRGEIDPGDLGDARIALAVERHVRSLAFPDKTQDTPDFGEQVANLIAHGMTDEEIYTALGGDQVGDMLVALVRVLMSKQQLEED